MFYLSSIKRFLLFAVLSIISVAWGLSAVFNVYSSKEQVEELFDAELAQMSRILQSVMTKHLHTSTREYVESLRYLDKNILAENFGHQEFTDQGHKYEKKLAFQVWDLEGNMLFENTSGLPKNFNTLKPGYETVGADKRVWRTFTLKDTTLGLWIKTAQREDVRTELTSEIAMNTMIPSLILLPVLIFVIALLIRKGLSPLNHISQALKKRGYQNLEMIPASEYPVELRYLVGELNDLFTRVSEASERERRFTADAAHELRTPLSISKVHLQNILHVSESEQVKEFVEKALIGIERLIHMVQQLLILSRLDAQQEQEDLTDVSLVAISHDILNDLTQQGVIQSKRVDIGGEASIVWRGHEFQIRILLRNLLDNACRYAQDNTQVSLSIEKGQFSIRNVCPFMTEEMLLRCLERFKRGVSKQQGSGLGLSICQQICTQNHYVLSMNNRTDGVEGIEVSIVKK